MTTPIPLNKKLYSDVVKMANIKFKAPSSIYRSSWIVREYKKRGGTYSGTASETSGLKRWFKEDWIDLNRPIVNSKNKIIGYEKCGRKSSEKKGLYPLCRPNIKVTKSTPLTYNELSKNAIKNANSVKQKYKYKKHVKFDI